MDDDIEMRLLRGSAYRIFFEELHKHLDQTRHISEWSALPGSDTVYEACARFHTIKGGAGFFQLKDIALLAGRLEDLLHSPREVLNGELPTVRTLVGELCDLADKIPEPTVIPQQGIK